MRLEMAPEDEQASELTNLQDDSVKLVAYTIVSLKRGHERILDGGEGSVLVTESMTARGFRSWILAKYMQQEIDVPGEPGKQIRRGDARLLPKEELKYLRVFYVIPTRWPREPLEFEEKQIEILRDIRDEISQ